MCRFRHIPNGQASQSAPDTSVWVVDYGDSHLTHLSSSGQALSGTSGYTSGALAFPVAAAIESSHNVWVANRSGTTVTRVSPDGSQFADFSCCDGPSGLAIDQLGNVWVANYYGNSIREISSGGMIVASGAYTSGGLNHPQTIAIDGARNVWVANFRSPSITDLAGATATTPGAALSISTGLGARTLRFLRHTPLRSIQVAVCGLAISTAIP